MKSNYNNNNTKYIANKAITDQGNTVTLRNNNIVKEDGVTSNGNDIFSPVDELARLAAAPHT